MKVLILDNSIDHEIYDPLSHWQRFVNCGFDSFHASKGEFPDGIDEYTHIILTGSEASIMEATDWSAREEEIVREAVSAGKAVLGSCYGHQLLARALFGGDAVGKSATPEVGWDYLDIVRSDKMLGEKETRLPTFLIHFDEVKDVPKHEAYVLASTPICSIQIFRLKHKPVWGIQAHPEISIKEGFEALRRMIELATHEKSKELRIYENALETIPVDAAWFHGFMDEFLGLK